SWDIVGQTSNMHDDGRGWIPVLFVPLMAATCARLPPEPSPWASIQPPQPAVHARRDAPAAPEPQEALEPAPAHLGTPMSSRAAAPKGWLDSTNRHAPQPPDARRLFAAGASEGEISGLACRISVDGYRGVLGGLPKLRADVTFVDGRERF